MINNLRPILFARTVRQALDYRRAGMEKEEAIIQACDTVGLDTDWVFVIQSMLEYDATIAELWANQQIESALDHATIDQGAFR